MLLNFRSVARLGFKIWRWWALWVGVNACIIWKLEGLNVTWHQSRHLVDTPLQSGGPASKCWHRMKTAAAGAIPNPGPHWTLRLMTYITKAPCWDRYLSLVMKCNSSVAFLRCRQHYLCKRVCSMEDDCHKVLLKKLQNTCFISAALLDTIWYTTRQIPKLSKGPKLQTTML